MDRVGFAERLRRARRERGLGVGALADLIGVSRVQVWRYERGRQLPTVEILSEICRVLDVDAAQLVT